MKRFVLAILSCMFVSSVFPQLTGQLIEKSLKFNTPFTVTKYSTKEGLPQSQVIKIFKKNDGALILYTANGIVEFDGYDFIEFIKDDKYKKQFFRNLYYRSKKDELIGLDDNQHLYRITTKLEEIDWPGSDLTYIMLAGDSLIGFHTSGKLTGYDLEKRSFYDLPGVQSCFRGNNIDILSAYINKGLVYFSTDEGLFSFEFSTGKCKMLADDPCSVIKLNTCNDLIYAAYNDNVYVIKRDEVVQTIKNKRLKEQSVVYDLAFPTEENIYLATSTGLFAYEFGGFDLYGKNDGLPSEHIVSVLVDSLSECVFVGTGEKGLLKLQYKNNYSYSKNEGLGVNAVNSIVRTPEGKVLVSYSCCDMYNLRSDTAFAFTGKKANYASLAVIDNKLFAGTWGDGVKIFEENKFVDSLNYPFNLPSGQVQACYKDTKGTIWIGTANGVATGQSIRSVRPALSEIKETVICFYEMKDASICIGVVGGFYIVKNNRVISRVGYDEGFYGKEVRAFYEDSEGKLWIGSYNGGLYCYNKHKLVSINKMKNCLLDNDVFTLAGDQYGRFFVTSNHGLWQVAEKDLNDFYYGKINYLVPFHYTEESGILNTEFNGGFQNNYLETKNSHFYFPSLEGVVMTLQEETPFRKLKPRISYVMVNNEKYDGTDRVFDKTTKSVRFHFNCVNFSAKNNIYFQFRLLGEGNSGWSTPQKNTTVDLQLLPSGKYIFQVRAIDGFNDRDPLTESYEFQITPWFYEQLWFRIVVVLFLALLLFSFAWWRFSMVRKKQQEKDRIQRRIAELELSVLHAQMNPHFIFNSLNSLKYFLNVGDIKNADMFIDNFSYLLRKVMVYSSEKLISVSEEVSMLAAYVELEKMRMNNRLYYAIEVDRGMEEKLIPTFMIQPFIENSIKHGFAHKEGLCKLSVLFKYNKNTICCVIEDDGIGRKKAREIGAGYMYHESKGISNVLERIAIKKDTYGKNISIEIIDKKDVAGSPKGTMVVINIEEINDTYDNNRG